MLKIPKWIIIHRILIKYKTNILGLFLSLDIFAFLLIIFGFYTFGKMPNLFNFIFSLRNKFGTFSLLLFLLTLLPGTFSRLKVFPLLTASIAMFRRQIGVLMFLIALVHSFYISTIPAVLTSTFNLSLLTNKELFGTIATLILLPVWLTSNDFSVKNMGKFWKLVQRLTYLSLIVIYMHVSMTSFKSGLATFLVLILELYSWIKVKFLDKQIS